MTYIVIMHSLAIHVQKVGCQPPATWAAYWPKIECFLKWLDRHYPAEREDPDKKFGCTIEPSAFVEFIDAIEHNRGGLGVSTQGGCSVQSY